MDRYFKDWHGCNRDFYDRSGNHAPLIRPDRSQPITKRAAEDLPLASLIRTEFGGAEIIGPYQGSNKAWKRRSIVLIASYYEYAQYCRTQTVARSAKADRSLSSCGPNMLFSKRDFDFNFIFVVKVQP